MCEDCRRKAADGRAFASKAALLFGAMTAGLISTVSENHANYVEKVGDATEGALNSGVSTDDIIARAESEMNRITDECNDDADNLTEQYTSEQIEAAMQEALAVENAVVSVGKSLRAILRRRYDRGDRSMSRETQEKIEMYIARQKIKEGILGIFDLGMRGERAAPMAAPAPGVQ